ncbi:MAG TPA: hypothetical protein DD713_05375 [Nitrospiraceae bacterium]|nr:hypothetical protein [Nitrospiraceae bacterium]
MSRRRNRKRTSARFVQIFTDMLKSPAWEKLSNSSRVTYIHIKSKCYSSDPTVDLTLSFNEMEKIMARKTFARSLRELEQSGFITITQRGGLFRKRNFFKLSDDWRNIKDK